MKSKIIAGSVIAAILIAGLLIGYTVHRIQHKNFISEAQSLFDQGKYEETIALLGSSVQGDEPAPEERVLAAESFYRMRQYDRAQKILDPSLRTGQEDAKALALSGWLWIQENSPIQAETRFQKAGKMGLQAEFEGGMGAVALLRSENYRTEFLNEAQTHLNKSIAADPANPKVYLVLAELHRLRQQYDDAIACTEKAIQYAPHWSGPHAMLGRLYMLTGKHQEAEKAFTESQKFGGSKEETQYYLALSVYYQGRLSESLALLRELINTGQEKVKDALLDAARISMLLNTGNALADLRQAWKIQPDPLTGMQLYEVLTRQNQWEEAETILKEVVAEWPYLSLAHMEMGHFWLKQNEFTRAYSSYQSVLERDGGNYWANFNLGYISPQRGDFNHAPGYFEATVREYEDFFPAQVNLVLAQLAVDRRMDAENQLADLLTRYPGNPYLLLARALERFAAGDSGSALDYLERSLQAGQDQAAPYVIRGEILMRLFQFDKAIQSFGEALKIEENNPRALLGKAHASCRSGDFPQAEQGYQTLFETLASLPKERQAEVQNGLAIIALEQGDSQKSQEIWEQLKRNDAAIARQFAVINEGLIDENSPDPVKIEDLKIASMARNTLPEAFYNMAVFQHTLNQSSESIETYETLIQRYPGYLPGLFNLANLYRDTGRRGDSLALYERAKNTAPDRVDILNNQAAIYAFTERWNQAKESLDSAEAIDPNFIEIRFNQILIALRENQVERAGELLKEYKTSSISSALIEMAEGLILMAQERWQEAEKALSKARNSDSQNAFACLNHGITLAKLKRYPESQAAIRESIQCDPSLACSRRALGLLYCELGLFDLAEAELQASLQLDPLQTDLNQILNQISQWMREIKPSNP